MCTTPLVVPTDPSPATNPGVMIMHKTKGNRQIAHGIILVLRPVDL